MAHGWPFVVFCGAFVPDTLTNIIQGYSIGTALGQPFGCLLMKQLDEYEYKYES